MNTPTPAHVALVASLQVAMRRVELVDKTAFPSFSDIASAEAQIDKARSDLYEALAQPALAAPAESPLLRKFLDAAGGEGLVLDGVDAGDLYVSMYGHEPVPKPIPAASPIAAWQNFPGYLIDHREGDAITEEGLQRALSAMLADPTYAVQPTPAASPDEATKAVHVGMTVAGNGAAMLGALMREQHDSRRGVYPDGNPNSNVVPVAAPVAPTKPPPENSIVLALAMFPVNLRRQAFQVNGGQAITADGDDHFYSAKKVEAFIDAMHGHLTAALSAAKPELSDAQIARGWVTEDVAPTDDPESLFFAGARYAMKTLKLQAGGEA